MILAAGDNEFNVVHILGTMSLAEIRALVDSKFAYNMSGLSLLGSMGSKPSIAAQGECGIDLSNLSGRKIHGDGGGAGQQK